MNRKRIVMVLPILALLFSSCATIIGGKSNTLVFSEESLPKAEVFIDGEKIGDAPGKIKIPAKKIQHGSKLTIKAEGHEKKEFIILRKQNAIYTIADLLTGVIPLIVDYGNGNIYRPRPRKFEYKLEKETNPQQAQR